MHTTEQQDNQTTTQLNNKTTKQQDNTEHSESNPGRSLGDIKNKLKAVWKTVPNIKMNNKKPNVAHCGTVFQTVFQYNVVPPRLCPGLLSLRSV